VKLNLCGGATSAAEAQPVVAAAGPGFVADPGTIQTVGQLPDLTARLNALANALHVTIYGISGYRTPAHSVAVGGYADDPHTKGQAEDIGVNSLLRSSAAQISEAQLARFGLYRPFDPSDNPSNSEVNHIQLIPSGGPLPLTVADATFLPDPSCS
jgi:Peptidase M15